MLYIVGAGPGSPDLISLRAYHCLQKAQVVLYDALVCMDILDFCPAECLRIFVGKRGKQTSIAQNTIHDHILHYCQQYERVVRLKGGDPFVFGRGYEEIQFATAHQIAVELIPGISSALSVPALQGIPLTWRECSSSFWVLTGTTAEKTFSKDLHIALQSQATLVILMGMHQLEAIVDLFLQHNKALLPIAIIQNGTFPNEKIVVGTIATIIEQTQQAEMGSPAVIVIGEVVRCRTINH